MMRVQQSSLGERHISRISYHSKQIWVPYERKLSHKSNS